MKTITITTPENIEVEYRLAGVGSRVVAAFLDYFIQGVLYVMILLAVAGIDNPIQYLESKSSYVIAMVILMMACINYGYFILSEMTMNGKTLGKKVLRLKTIRKNGQPMDIKHSLIRNLFRVFVDNYMIGILMIFFKKNYSRLGDVVASTMVIEEEKQEFSFSNDELTEALQNKITEEEKELLTTYIHEKESIMIGKETLKERMLDYFRTKYDTIDPELVRWIEQQINEGVK
ncbi:RDD family protein [Clostridiaceae bacterium 35-E11]